jgi:hypothetical protein
MVDLVVTAANVVKGSRAKVVSGTYGATVTAGQTVYADPADSGRYKLADADSATEAVRATAGIALNSGSAGQPADVQESGRINPGATVTVGTIYVQSDTPGGIMPAADLEAGDYVTVLGVGVSASQIDLNIHRSGVAVPA